MNFDELRTRNFMSPREAAEFFATAGQSLDERTVRRAAEEGQIPSVKVGAKTLIPVPPLLALLEVHRGDVDAAVSVGISLDAVRVAIGTIRAAIDALETLLAEDTSADVISITGDADAA